MNQFIYDDERPAELPLHEIAEDFAPVADEPPDGCDI